MRYFIIDEVNNDGNELYECKSEAEFNESLFYNRGIAKEYGDKVETLKEVRSTLKSGKPCSFSFNAFSFVKGAKLLKDYGYIQGEDY